MTQKKNCLTWEIQQAEDQRLKELKQKMDPQDYSRYLQEQERKIRGVSPNNLPSRK